jgi:hypothetical protein
MFLSPLDALERLRHCAGNVLKHCQIVGAAERVRNQGQGERAREYAGTPDVEVGSRRPADASICGSGETKIAADSPPPGSIARLVGVQLGVSVEQVGRAADRHSP